ncbi:MAG: dephospho-CoA kinase [Oscillospiraceae bacterium]|nr:dephospho-CoA kinase [Oscillospiraceae bacterium]
MIIGLTGQTGAGKSEVCKLLNNDKITVINCDLLARKITEKGSEALNELVLAFGKQILCKDKTLDRKKLASLAFKDKQSTQLLNKITHPHIINEIKKQIINANTEYTILDAPTLFESGADKLCDKTVAVIADENIRINRIIKRDNLSREDALLRLSAQKGQSFFVNNCDYIIKNDGDLSALKNEVQSLLKNLGVN